ncbi:M16 family metallopeptidase [Limnobaculum xujianqingii]|uniref:M16 family metallopeptidase n=1 Tax=Limnobaculum xujianqingii TaxID=2738837 RepID=UPI001128345B|nr:pitrilysin family protein [Limnobaculum xujianqingii]
MHSKFLRSALGGLVLIMAEAAQAEPLKADPAWQEGKLENGFKWQVLATPHRPTDKIEVRLEINAGSLQESIPQVGFSYLLPRLATSQTENFSNAEMQALLPQILPDAEPKYLVEVSYDYTRYNLSLPNNRPEILKEAFSWLSDAVNRPTATNEQIQAIRSEFTSPLVMLPSGLNDAWWRYRIKNSPLMGHEPGQTIVADASAEQLGEFYSKWYTPDAMTLYVVGNVDRRVLNDQINKAFGGLSGKRETPATIAVLSALPPTPVSFSSQGVTKDRIKLVWDDPWHPVVTTASLERQWLSMIANDMIKNRLNQKLGRSVLKGEPLNIECQVQFQRYKCNMTLDVQLPALKSSIKQLGTELVKLDKEGITEAELKALVAAQKEQLDKAIATYAKTDTTEIMNQRLLIQKSGSIAVDPESYQQLNQKFLSSLTTTDVNARIHQILTIKPTMVLTQPAGEPEENVKVLADLLDSVMTPKAEEAK